VPLLTDTAAEPKHDAVPIVKNLIKELLGEIPPEIRTLPMNAGLQGSFSMKYYHKPKIA
jgi:hypothetical protein